jgi:hypothetical protein
MSTDSPEQKKEDLAKGWKELLLGTHLLTSPVAHQNQVQFDPTTLHHELKPIAELESSGGKNMQHKVSAKGDYDTAFGALGYKPMVAHETYLKSKHLQKLYPNLNEVNDFTHAMKENPQFYNALASQHWNNLKKLSGNDISKAVYSWRWGAGAASKAKPEQIQGDSYVKKYHQIAGHLNKAIGDIRPGVFTGKRVEGAKIYNYDHVLSPQHIAQGYSMHVEDYGPTPEEPNQHDVHVIVRHPMHKERIGYITGKHYAMNHSVDPEYSEILNPVHRGKGLGQAMYEAFYAHGKHVKGATRVIGGIHSSAASGLHSKLAQKHGLNYKPMPNGYKLPERNGAFDFAHAPYEYALKSQEDMNKDLDEWVQKRGVKDD